MRRLIPLPLVLGIVLGILAGCTQGKPLTHVAADEIPPGPGLFSGEEGEFVLFRR